MRTFLDKQEHHFTQGKLKMWLPVFEMIDTILYSTGKTTKSGSHIRDALDLKRMMILVVFALVPTVIMALYNTGLQANLAMAAGAESTSWQAQVVRALGIGFNPRNIGACMAHGALYFLPIYILTLAVGAFWEVLFAVVRKHEIAEGFLVTSLLIPLILPPDIPYWQVAIGVTFGIVIGKEVFGGVGMNILNPALTTRAFLFFAYPAQISGDKVWVAVDGVSQPTILAQFADPLLDMTYTWKEAFLGFVPGSMGETSTLACLLGAAFLILTKVGSWRIMLTILLGMTGMSLIFNLIGSDTNPMFAVTPLWHLVIGGFAFGAVYMATDPVSATMTEGGKWVYGALIGILVVLIRVVNPAFPEGMMLAILFMNVFAPIIDKVVINANVKRRLARDVK
ncbi:NADH:ubiquinone reductase (Na(+)-transporting) subunit B [candidate division KSB1 bacterium]|nr:NADH:ubiquinone reductase (Na(+)-transporting) subunit B [candidate division KSB1 bacterium]